MDAVVTEQNFDVVPTRLAVKAMRDSGYKNAAFAIAELVDNAVQAGARCVEILCKEDEALAKQNVRRRIQQIAVIDDGQGMSAEVLRRALQFGNGERLDDRSGIGRFGMGPPFVHFPGVPRRCLELAGRARHRPAQLSRPRRDRAGAHARCPAAGAEVPPAGVAEDVGDRQPRTERHPGALESARQVRLEDRQGALQ
ncbi:MAG: ATP-binding protein [Deltaproteobacteria bacterium]|nr:ATP-binding protein [Deltaproteobacteria bacterium]